MRKKSESRHRKKRSLLLHERKALKAGFKLIAGIDEAGRGPLAGPVVAAALILTGTCFRQIIDDSKKLTPKSRVLAYNEILQKARIGIGVVSEKIIDKINIYNATAKAMEKAVKNLEPAPDFLLVDGRIRLTTPCKRSHIIRGDSKSLSIACASIVAKVTRDRMMLKYHKKFPQYGFARHKGYGTRLHFLRLKEHGPCPIHRFTFTPVKQHPG